MVDNTHVKDASKVESVKQKVPERMEGTDKTTEKPGGSSDTKPAGSSK